MNKEFVPYEQSLELKELGFDEHCLGFYHKDTMFVIQSTTSHDQYYGQICLAPLYQQAFRWFREKHGLHYNMQVQNGRWFFERWSLDVFKTYEETELACLKKLIQIVKEQTKVNND